MMFPYVKNKLLTDAELQLYHFLVNNLCQSENIAVLAKVRLGDIVDVDPLVQNSEKFYFDIAKKHIDFVICRNDTMDTICTVELDDVTHINSKVKQRDDFVKSVLDAAKIPLVRIRKPIADVVTDDLSEIDRYINIELAPNCPFCGEKMVPTKYKWDKNRFFLCPNYKNRCKYIVKIDGAELP